MSANTGPIGPQQAEKIVANSPGIASTDATIEATEVCADGDFVVEITLQQSWQTAHETVKVDPTGQIIYGIQ